MIKALKKTYIRMAGENSLVLLRAIKTYYVSPTFRVNVLIEYLNMNGANRSKIRKKLLLKYGVEIAENSKIGEGCIVEHYNGLVIGGDVVLGNNSKLHQQVTIGQKDGKYPVIGNNVTIYPGAKIFGGIKIGNNVVVGANSVVNIDVPDDAVVAGNPAKVIKLKGGNYDLN